MPGIHSPAAVQSVVGRRGERHRIVRELVAGLGRPHLEHQSAPGLSGRLVESIGLAAGWLLDRQADDGHWRGPLEGDTILESEYLLILAWAGRLDASTADAACRRILQQQLDCGGWSIHPGGPVDVSASVKAYLGAEDRRPGSQLGTAAAGPAGDPRPRWALGGQQLHQVLSGTARPDPLLGLSGGAAGDGAPAALVSNQSRPCLCLVSHDDRSALADVGLQARSADSGLPRDRRTVLARRSVRPAARRRR